ncbi:hypothetical protein OU426_13765 [Frigidibacter sp. RF13]|uniref:hypothetical protein n=1 Tax=Frigidibacter sp. RF13 TaxID=2997340 RepID=UPI00226EDB92|nr:hypothetical protein [Frigidibacter sp. RF13]MCY1127927.1 hypothetical protein [Frigidibacter sp. RF13]
MERAIRMLIRAAMDTVFRHLPGWLARRGGNDGTAQGRARIRTNERDMAKKMRMIRKLTRWLR